MSNQKSHARRNQLTGEWVLVSPQRLARPWGGQLEASPVKDEQPYDVDCYLCPGNQRANGAQNPAYAGPFVFDNDFSALTEVSELAKPAAPLLESRAESGRCRVLCYSQKHNKRLATMSIAEISAAIDAMVSEFCTLDAMEDIAYVQIFENRGAMMGCSNQHPHAQIWATQNLPNEPRKELQSQQIYFDKHGSSLLRDYLEAELESGARLVTKDKHFVALVPYWATWPFETLIVPIDPMAALDQLNADKVQSLAAIWQRLFSAYDALFDVETPYSIGFHPRPSDGATHPEWQLHMHIYPPLLRSARVRKHMVGFEMLAMPQRDLTPEFAAGKLRELCAGQSTQQSRD